MVELCLIELELPTSWIVDVRIVEINQIWTT